MQITNKPQHKTYVSRHLHQHNLSVTRSVYGLLGSVCSLLPKSGSVGRSEVQG